MLVLARVPPAFFPTDAACLLACFDDPMEHADILSRAPGSHGGCRDADIGTIEIEANALLQVIDRLLGETSIGAGDARLRACVTFFNAPQQAAGCVTLNIRVRTDHLLNLHGALPMSLSAYC
jgi:hypothetical protein